MAGGSGILLLVGYLTPVAAALAVLTCAGAEFSWFPVAAPNLFDTRLTCLFAVTMAVALLCLGPGAISLDARLYGRREIVIPKNLAPPR